MMKGKRMRFAALLLGLLLVVGGPVPAAGAEAPDGWAVQEVEYAIGLGLVPEDLQNGYSRDITRGEFCRLRCAFDENCGAQFFSPRRAAIRPAASTGWGGLREKFSLARGGRKFCPTLIV